MTARNWDKARQHRIQQREDRIAPAPITAWWLTLSRYDSRCDECGEMIPGQSRFAWNHVEKRAACEVCIDRYRLSVQPSRKLLAVEAHRGEGGIAL